MEGGGDFRDPIDTCICGGGDFRDRIDTCMCPKLKLLCKRIHDNSKLRIVLANV